MTDFERRIDFEPGYNHLHETDRNKRSRHGMAVRFVLIGELGASQFLMNTGWTPLGEVDKDAPGKEPCHVDHWRVFHGHQFGTVNTPSGWDLGYHWKTPLYEGADQRGEVCEYLGVPCYYDGSGLAADEVLRDFIREGDKAVWRWLEKRYQWCVDEAAEYAKASA